MLNYLLVYKKTIVENIIVGFIFSSIWIVLPVVKTEKELICAIIFISVGVIVKNIFNIYKR